MGIRLLYSGCARCGQLILPTERMLGHKMHVTVQMGMETMKTLLSFITAALLCWNIVSSVSAATVDVTVEGVVVGDTFGGTMGTGTLSYDDTTLTNTGAEVISSLVGGLTLDFTIFGQTFHTTDDVNFPPLQH